MFLSEKKHYLQQQGFSEFCPKAALIDMDGVLFDSMPNHAISWSKVLGDMGIPFDKKEAYLHEGRTGKGTIEIVFRRECHREPTEQEIKDIYAQKASLFDQLPEASIMDGATEMLDTIRDSGMKRILVTGSGQKMLLNKIDRLFPGHFTIDRMVTAFDVKQGKPYPEPYLMGLKKGGLKANEAIVIENAPLGVEAAKAAGIFTIAVNTGPLDDDYLYRAGCDLLFHHLHELTDAWSEITQKYTL